MCLLAFLESSYRHPLKFVDFFHVHIWWIKPREGQERSWNEEEVVNIITFFTFHTISKTQNITCALGKLVCDIPLNYHSLHYLEFPLYPTYFLHTYGSTREKFKIWIELKEEKRDDPPAKAPIDAPLIASRNTSDILLPLRRAIPAPPKAPIIAPCVDLAPRPCKD